MAYELGKHPGTLWHKCDFQCHTPRDRSWSGSPDLPGGTEASEQARHDWATDFVGAAVAGKLSAVAISDHHDVCMSRYVIEAVKRLDSNLLVYPAIEVTCSDNAQCLVIIDPSANVDTQKMVLAKAGNILIAADAAAKTCEILPAHQTVSDFVAAIQSEAHLKDVCAILPHFSTQDAHKSLNEHGHHPRFANLPVDGVYIEHPYPALDKVTLDKIQGKIGDWGKRRRAIVATGDNRAADWKRLGAHDCWIKLGEHSIEAFRQALLADEARIAFLPPVSPTEHLVEMRVKSTLTGAAVVTVAFNNGFNAFIGGRGSGKSAFLEYLRFGLGRTDKDINNSDSENDREAKLIEETLTGDGYVEVLLEREGVRETWKRTTANSELILISTASGTLDATTSVARERFRARAFRQKGLSSTMNDPTTAAEQITNIAAAEEVDKQRIIERSIANARRTVTTAFRNLVSLWQARLESKQAKDKVDDLRQRLSALAARLEAEGASAEALKTLEDSPKYSRASEYIAETASQANSLIRDLGETGRLSLAIDLAGYEGAGEFEEVSNLEAAVARVRSQIADQIAKATFELNGLLEVQAAAAGVFQTRHNAFLEKYNAALVEQGKHTSLIEEVNRLTRELQTGENELSRARAAETGKSPFEKAYEDAVTELDFLLDERRAILKDAADKVAGMSSNLLQARVRRDRMPTSYLTAFHRLFEGSGTQQVEESCTDWLKVALAEDASVGWATLRKAFLELYAAKIGAGSPPEASDGMLGAISTTMFNSARQLTERQRKKIYVNLTDDVIGGIVSAVPRDTIHLNYMDEGRSIDFKMASPGQQASALLELLLKQSAGTLIVDQPEDDLDNRVITRIVELLRHSKSNRQLIFSIHNSNIVVNGDADKVIALRSSEPSSNPHVNSARVQIDCDGAIETQGIAPTITAIMEGGREAFDLRSRKYRFELA